MASAEAFAAADVAKAAANKLYAENKLDEAIDAYTAALQLLPELDGSDEDVVASLVGSKEAGLRAILLTNRAQCLLMQVRLLLSCCTARHAHKSNAPLPAPHCTTQGKALVASAGLHSPEARKLFMKAAPPPLPPMRSRHSPPTPHPLHPPPPVFRRDSTPLSPLTLTPATARRTTGRASPRWACPRRSSAARKPSWRCRLRSSAA